jgi:hypothetical protein
MTAWRPCSSRRAVGVACTIALIVAGLFASSAFWQTLRPPLQDLPQHLAAARVLLDRAHPGFEFDRYFEVDWLRSQYLGTYVLLGAFFHPLRLFLAEPMLWACRCLLVFLALAWPLSTELLYRRLGRPAGLGAFALVLFFNAHLILGFLNFLLGIVACFTALGCLVGARARVREQRRHVGYLVGWGAAALACFYFHVVPFALLVLVVGASFASERVGPALASGVRRGRGERPAVRAPLRARLAAAGRAPEARPYWAFMPALIASSAWLFTPAGVSARDAARGAGARGRAVFSGVEANWAELSSWLMDAFGSEWDTRWAAAALGVFALWLLIEACSAVSARRRSVAAPAPAAPDATALASAAMPLASATTEPARGCTPPDDVEPEVDRLLLWVLRGFVPLCFALYFALPSSYDWIWPINARFPLLGLLFLPLWAPSEGSCRGRAWLLALRGLVVALALGFSSGEAIVARQAFAGVERETRDLDALLSSIPPGRRTASLIFERFSRQVAFAPFLHIGAYYQAERGGVSFFSFADFPQSPIRFRPDNRPPRVRARWEWAPELVRDRDLAWFEYVITRGGPGRLASSRRFEAAGRFGAYRLFRNRNAAP